MSPNDSKRMPPPPPPPCIPRPPISLQSTCLPTPPPPSRRCRACPHADRLPSTYKIQKCTVSFFTRSAKKGASSVGMPSTPKWMNARMLDGVR